MSQKIVEAVASDFAGGGFHKPLWCWKFASVDIQLRLGVLNGRSKFFNGVGVLFRDQVNARTIVGMVLIRSLCRNYR